MVSSVCSAMGLIKTQALFLVQEQITVKHLPLFTLSCSFMTQNTIVLENDVVPLLVFFKKTISQTVETDLAVLFSVQICLHDFSRSALYLLATVMLKVI